MSFVDYWMRGEMLAQRLLSCGRDLAPHAGPWPCDASAVRSARRSTWRVDHGLKACGAARGATRAFVIDGWGEVWSSGPRVGCASAHLLRARRTSHRVLVAPERSTRGAAFQSETGSIEHKNQNACAKDENHTHVSQYFASCRVSDKIVTTRHTRDSTVCRFGTRGVSVWYHGVSSL